MLHWNGTPTLSYEPYDMVCITWRAAEYKQRMSWLKQIYPDKKIDVTLLARRDFEDLSNHVRTELIRMGSSLLVESIIDFSEADY